MIHRLYSPNEKRFKELVFRPGLNVLLSEKSEGAKDKASRNGAGKTSFIELIHFLCGGDLKRRSPLRANELKNTTFALDLDINGTVWTVQRTPSTARNLRLKQGSRPWRTASPAEWRDELGRRMFGLRAADEASGPASRAPTFEQLFAYFVRRERDGAFSNSKKSGFAYSSQAQGVGQMQVAVSWLLGLDWHVSAEFAAWRDRTSVLRNLRAAAKAGALGAVMDTSAKLKTRLALATNRRDRLAAQLKDFRVNEQYAELERERAELERVWISS